MQKEFKRIIDKLNEIPTEEFVGTYGDHELVHSVIDSCIEIVEQVASECSNDWIPCTQSMPEDILTYNKNTSFPIINVLVTTENGKVTKAQRLGSRGYDKADDLNWYWGRIRGGIKAWQPLPEGYKGKQMELVNKYKGSKYEEFNEFFSEITDELDKLAGIKPDDEYYSWKHYILANKFCIKERCLAIRIPGGTVGGIWIDDNGLITKITVDTNYVVKTYPKDVNEQIQKFVGCKIDDWQLLKERVSVSK